MLNMLFNAFCIASSPNPCITPLQSSRALKKSMAQTLRVHQYHSEWLNLLSTLNINSCRRVLYTKPSWQIDKIN